MATPSSGEITRLLAGIRHGEPDAEERLIALVYAEFRNRAGHYMRGERADHTLQPTALVNEAYMRLMREGAPECQNRAHFFATASLAMRRVLVDHARSRAAGKRPDGKVKVDLDQFFGSLTPRMDEMLILDEALTRLSAMSPRQGRLVEMIYFGGLTHDEAAEVLGIAARTVKRDWDSARAWLIAELERTRP